MVKAARRGVDVRLLLPYKTDRPIALWVARAAYNSLIQSGVKIFEYSPRFLHAKIMLIDNHWASVGSTNLDYRSFFINLELNLVSTDSFLIESLSAVYENNLSMSAEITSHHLVKNKWLNAVYQALEIYCRKLL